MLAIIITSVHLPKSGSTDLMIRIKNVKTYFMGETSYLIEWSMASNRFLQHSEAKFKFDGYANHWTDFIMIGTSIMKELMT